MDESPCYESFPLGVVVLTNLLSLAVYALGAWILAGWGIWVAIPYLLYCLLMEVTVMRRSCVKCYYYGKVCAFGKGKLCSLFFKPGDPQEFAERQISWVEIIPDFLVFIIPVVGGIALLIRDFSWVVLAMVAGLLLLSLGGNAFVRGTFACRYCKQKESGCPAAELFGQEDASA